MQRFERKMTKSLWKSSLNVLFDPVFILRQHFMPKIAQIGAGTGLSRRPGPDSRIPLLANYPEKPEPYFVLSWRAFFKAQAGLWPVLALARAGTGPGPSPKALTVVKPVVNKDTTRA